MQEKNHKTLINFLRLNWANKWKGKPSSRNEIINHLRGWLKIDAKIPADEDGFDCFDPNSSEVRVEEEPACLLASIVLLDLNLNNHREGELRTRKFRNEFSRETSRIRKGRDTWEVAYDAKGGWGKCLKWNRHSHIFIWKKRP